MSSPSTTSRPRWVTWLFADRETGRLVFGQFPNLPLWIFLAAVVVRLIFRPTGDLATVVEVIADGALLWWAGLEIVSGVNPWRRGLGVVVAAFVIVGVLLTWL